MHDNKHSLFVGLYTLTPHFSEGICSKTPTKHENNWPFPLKQCSIIYYCFSLLCRNAVIDASYFFPSTSWTSSGMTQRPNWIVKHFWCSYQLKSPSDIFLFLGLHHKFVKQQSVSPQRSRDEIICKKLTIDVWNAFGLRVYWQSTM